MFCVDFLEGNMERLFTWGICETAALENYSQKCLNKNQREELLHYFDVRRRQKYISEAEPFLNKDGDTKDIWFDSLVQLMAQVGLKISTLQKDFEDSNDLGEETFSESIAGNEGNMQAFSQALQMLLILCYKPKMIFGKNSEDNQVEFERILGKIYKQLDDFFECGILFYMFRQKIDKREDSIKDYRCFLVDKDGLIESINATYVRYYLELKGIDIPVKRRPKVNTELISRCLETKSLLPMAHIILLRDAEYQMLDLKKYSNSKLLPYGGAENYVFTFDNLTEEKKKEINRINCKYLKELRKIIISETDIMITKSQIGNIFSEYLQPFLRSPQGHKISKIGKKRESEIQEDQLQKEIFGFYLKNDIDKWQELREGTVIEMKEKIKNFYLFSCNKEEVALRIAIMLNFDEKQLLLLQKTILTMLWKNRSEISRFKNLLIKEDRKRFREILTALHNLLIPKYYLREYEKADNAVSVIEKNVKILFKNGFFGSNPENQKIEEQIGIVYTSFFELKNISAVASLYTGIYDIRHIKDKDLPKILTSCRRKLRKKINSYIKKWEKNQISKFELDEEEFLEKVRKCKIELGNNGNIREYKEALACVYRGSTTDKKMDIQSAANILNKYVIGQQPRNIFDVDIRKELQEEMCAKNNWENTLSICEQIFSSNDNGELNRHLIELEMADKVIRKAKEVIIQEATVLMVKGVWILLQEEIRGCSLEVSELEYEDDMLSADHEGIIDDRDPEEIPNNNERYIERNQKNKEKSFEKKREENFLKHYTGF